MIEFVLIMPFLAVILGLTFFFGWALMHKQHVQTASRYAAWRRIETGAWPSEQDVNENSLDDRAERVNLSGSQYDLRRTATDLAGKAGSWHVRAGQYADDLIVERFPAGRRAEISAGFAVDTGLWERFVGDIHARHGREGVTWRRDEVNPWGTLRDNFYSDFDRDLRSATGPASGMARTIRLLYLANWPARPSTLD